VADNYFIFPNGRVYRCPLCEDYPLHSLEIRDDRLVETARINEDDLFPLIIPEGCVMNRIIQPRNLAPADGGGKPAYKIACCMLKEEITPIVAKAGGLQIRCCQGIRSRNTYGFTLGALALNPSDFCNATDSATLR
jgi:hypothetical protein